VPIGEAGRHDWYELVENLESSAFYRGVHLFPNVNLMIVAGTSFSVQTYNPLAADRTEMHMSVALTRSVRDFPHKPVVLWEHLRSDMTVLRQDVDCLEALQPSFARAGHEVFHGAYEGGIMQFQSACLSLLEEAPQ
jgi:hypothetical protein